MHRRAASDEAEALYQAVALAIRDGRFRRTIRKIVASFNSLAFQSGRKAAPPTRTSSKAPARSTQAGTTTPNSPSRSIPSYAVVKVYYATDRKKTSIADPAKIYGGDRGDLTLGICTVSIPRDHRMGELEAPSIWRLEWSKDPEQHVVLLSVTETGQIGASIDDVAARAKSAGKNAFIFVHGYNVTFADAARRTAQMAYDLGFDGAPVFYSWPSQASYASYQRR